MKRLKEKLKAIYHIIVDNSKMNYYFVSFAHAKGYGRRNIYFKGEFTLSQVEDGIMKDEKEEVVILYYKKISKKQCLGGFI